MAPAKRLNLSKSHDDDESSSAASSDDEQEQQTPTQSAEEGEESSSDEESDEYVGIRVFPSVTHYFRLASHNTYLLDLTWDAESSRSHLASRASRAARPSPVKP